MLPALLAEYKKYGSDAYWCLVLENHFCKSGAAVDIAKKGSPAESARNPINQGIGLLSPGVIDIALLLI